ncbi:hypothetical protein [Arthrobacter sp. H-02-3]|nr:hypothetical protein [Arthrobacter sp. H-02-3]
MDPRGGRAAKSEKIATTTLFPGQRRLLLLKKKEQAQGFLKHFH